MTILRYFLYLAYMLSVHSVINAQWLQTALNSACVNELTCIHGRIYSCTSQGLYYSVNNGLNWQPAGLDGMGVTSITSIDSVLVAGTFDQGLFTSSDTAKTWIASNTGISNYKITTVASANQVFYAGSYFGGIARSYNGGSTWSVITDPTYVTNKWILAIHKTDNTMFFLTGNTGVITYCLASCEGGLWSTQNTGLPAPVENLMCFSICTTHNQYLLGTSKGVYSSVQSPSLNWKYKGLENFYIHALASLDTLIIAGTDNGIFISTDTGNTWKQEQYGMPVDEVNTLLVNGNYILCGTKNHGLFIRAIDNLTGSATLSFNKKDNRLTVFPNPFRLLFTIHPPAFQAGSLQITDCQGNIMLLHQYLSPCTELNINAALWKPGLYIVHYLTTTKKYSATLVKIP